MPSHSHTRNGYWNTDNYSNNTTRQCASRENYPGDPISYGVNTTGGDDAHNNIQPYIACYIWQRIL